MSTLFSDSFNRADSGTVDATNWTEVVDSEWSISGNALVASATVSPPGMVRTTTTAHAAIADVRATAAIVSASVVDGGPIVRCDSAGTTFYGAFYNGTAIEVYRVNGGTETQLFTRTTALAQNDRLGLAVSGTGATVTLSVYRNGTQVGASGTDTSGSRITAAGQCGLWAYGSPAFDDFVVDDDLFVASGTLLRRNPGMTGGMRTMSGGMS
jgi:hypothetical protein